MQKKSAKAKSSQSVEKPILIGSWRGKDVFQKGQKLSLSILAISVLYLLLGMMLSFDSLVLRIILCVAMVGVAATYQYSQGLGAGQGDASFAEIMYARKHEGNPVTQAELERCFHPAKGFFAVLVGALPFVLLLLVFAVFTRPVGYVLGVLPSWVTGLTQQQEFGDALHYYQLKQGMDVMSVARIVVRAMVMPFVNVAVPLGAQATLWVERLSPLLVLLAPMGYGFGYRNGLKMRQRINAGIIAGDAKKKKKEQKARKQRARSKVPERLI